ncbi:LOW QUALITY PROTEIN: sphingosine-1-phosphate phosphatase 2 [Bombina bombina]|uniref:LOW QUALITY PROTEIN: sphingosine-1-phosphate phosphatase 2 n=1 Tax=Bombina bombina TaxID=8345 RepID=UPI00235A6BA6|nr:LOW QUALITY PROTEIN: sphingosine-1-phosphate phosphatase 2 [Bombina bombina]
MAQLLKTLQDPQLVAQFQRSCGLTLQPQGEANGVPSGHQSFNNYLEGRDKAAGGKGVPHLNGNKSYSNGSCSNGTHKQEHTKKYVVRNRLLYYLFRFAAALGQEVFYITFLPFTYWNIDPFIARRLILVWACERLPEGGFFPPEVTARFRIAISLALAHLHLPASEDLISVILPKRTLVSDQSSGDAVSSEASEVLPLGLAETPDAARESIRICPILYLLPKIHKSLEDPPGRPIISARGSLMQPLAEFIDFYLQPVVWNTSAHLKDSSELINLLKSMDDLTPTDILVTMDVLLCGEFGCRDFSGSGLFCANALTEKAIWMMPGVWLIVSLPPSPVESVNMVAVATWEDVVCGALIALLFLALTYPVWDSTDQLLLNNPPSPVLAVTTGFLLSYNYPKMDHYSTTRADTTTILGVGAGTCVGIWLANHFGLIHTTLGHLPLAMPKITFNLILMQVSRFLLGVFLLLITRSVAKTLSLQALSSWYKVSTQDPLVRQRLEIEVPYKFVTYTSIGVVATAGVPWLCQMLGM